MNIAVIGLGGVGGYYGGKLSQLLKTDNNLNLYFIARGRHLEEVRKNGLVLETADGSMKCVPTLATDNFDELPVLDLCLITVKSFELENVAEKLKPKTGPDTVIMALLNGADISERIRKIITNGTVLSSCVYIISYIGKPGVVVHKSPSCVIHTGNEKSAETEKTGTITTILELFDRAGINYKWHEDPRHEIWKKFLFIASFALVTARYDAVTGAVMESEEMSNNVKKIMAEIQSIARKKGIILSDEDCAKAYELGSKFDYNSTTSFQRDYRIKDKPDERDIFGEAIIRMGKEYGVNTDETARIYNELARMKPLP